ANFDYESDMKVLKVKKMDPSDGELIIGSTYPHLYKENTSVH
ncbi:MAG: hypothetical protein ACJASP_000359, partial [Roseivirga sp.]